MKAKKIALYVVGALVGLLLILGLIGTFMPQQGGAEHSGSDYHDPRLEQLRERSAELDEVFDGRSEMVDPGAFEEDPFAPQGQLSDFDSFSDAAEATGMPEEEMLVEPSPFPEEGA